MNWNRIKNVVLSDKADALKKLISSEEFRRSRPSTLLKTAALLRKIGRLSESLKLVEFVAPQFHGADLLKLLHLKADLHLDHSEFTKAIRCYDLILAKDKTDIAFNNRGFAYWSICRYKNALLDYKRALALNPKNITANRGTGEMLLKLERPDAAIPYFKAAIRLDPGYTDAYVGLGVAYYQMKEWVSSYDHLLKAAKLDPSNKLARKGIKKLEKHFDL